MSHEFERNHLILIRFRIIYHKFQAQKLYCYNFICSKLSQFELLKLQHIEPKSNAFLKKTSFKINEIIMHWIVEVKWRSEDCIQLSTLKYADKEILINKQSRSYPYFCRIKIFTHTNSASLHRNRSGKTQLSG